MSKKNFAWIWLCASGLAAGAHAGVNDFTLTGPEGASLYSVAFVPGKSTQVLAGGASGLYRSDNGGLSWTQQNVELLNAPTTIVFDPPTPAA